MNFPVYILSILIIFPLLLVIMFSDARHPGIPGYLHLLTQ